MVTTLRPFEANASLTASPTWMDDRFLTGQTDAAWHRENTANLSLTEYAKQKRMEIAQNVVPKVRIYLDQRYWIHCRAADSGEESGVYLEIWKILRRLVRDGLVVCPISSISVMETFKQMDYERRRHTAEIMDELSTGVALRSPSGLRAAEFQFLLRTLAGQPVSEHHPINYAFSSLAELFGDLAIEKKGDPEAEAMGKAALDGLSRLRFPDLLLAMPQIDRQLLEAYDRRSPELHNRIAARRSRTPRTYEAYLGREIHGVLDWLKAEILPNFMALSNAPAEGGERACAKFIELLEAKHNRATLMRALPTLFLRAAIYAATDFKQRRYNDGDTFDHDHAIVALPYCQIFLTERKLGTLLTERPAQLDRDYACRILWDADEVLAGLTAVARVG
jgi:hypothetical protein